VRGGRFDRNLGSMMSSILLAVTLAAAFYAGLFLLRRRGDVRPTLQALWPAGVVFGVTALLGIAQLIFPSVLTALERNGDKLRDGQIWRIFTPLFVQDGGGAGLVFNLAAMALLSVPFVLLFGNRRWFLLYFGTGLAAEIIAYTLINQGSAGNSVANFGVAAGLAFIALLSTDPKAKSAGVVASIAGLALLGMGNLHGAAFLVGFVLMGIGWLMGIRQTNRINTGQSVAEDPQEKGVNGAGRL
jgi:membrane associated rhomboid family serine protease